MIIVFQLSSSRQNIQKFLCSHHARSSKHIVCKGLWRIFHTDCLSFLRANAEDVETVFSTFCASQDSAPLERSEKQQLLVMTYWTCRKCGTVPAAIRRRTAKKSRAGKSVGMGKVASILKIICFILWKTAMSSYFAIVTVTDVKTCISVLLVIERTQNGVK